MRFERGVDPDGVDVAMRRFVTVLRETCPGAVLHAGMTVAETPSRPREVTLHVRSARVGRSLGIEPDGDRIASLIGPIGFVVRPVEGGADVTVPTFRPDCTEEIDIIEEIARHHGYDALGKSVPKSAVHGRLSGMQQRRRALRRVVIGLGLDEVMPMPFLAPGDLPRVGLADDDVLTIANPLVAEESVLRTSLRPGLLGAVRYNQSHRAPRIGLWETGHVYPRGAGALPDETEQLGIVVAGGDASTALAQWAAICDALGVGAQLDQSRVPPGLHPTRSASLTRGKKVVGVVGEVDPVVLDSLGIEGRVSILEVDLTVILNEEPKPAQARELNRFPSSDIDMAFVLPDSVPAQTLQRALRQAAGKRLVSIDLFDVYRGKGVDDGSRSLAFRLRLQEAGGTLTDAAIAEVQEACRMAAQKAGAVLRS